MQALFDCWVEQSELYSAIKQVSLCRDRFWQNLARLQRLILQRQPGLEIGGLVTQPQIRFADQGEISELIAFAQQTPLSVQLEVAEQPSPAFWNSLDEALASLQAEPDLVSVLVNPQLQLPASKSILARIY